MYMRLKHLECPHRKCEPESIGHECRMQNDSVELAASVRRHCLCTLFLVEFFRCTQLAAVIFASGLTGVVAAAADVQTVAARSDDCEGSASKGVKPTKHTRFIAVEEGAIKLHAVLFTCRLPNFNTNHSPKP